MLTWGVEHGVKIVSVQFEFFGCRVVQNLEMLHALLAADMLYWLLTCFTSCLAVCILLFCCRVVQHLDVCVCVVCVFMCMYAYAYVYVWTYVCMYTRMYVYIHTRTHMHTYIGA